MCGAIGAHAAVLSRIHKDTLRVMERSTEPNEGNKAKGGQAREQAHPTERMGRNFAFFFRLTRSPHAATTKRSWAQQHFGATVLPNGAQ